MATLDIVNYLAHAYLSFGIPDIVVGNLISDFIKGKKRTNTKILKSGLFTRGKSGI